MEKIQWQRIGKGKKAQAVLGVQKYDAVVGHAYRIVHHTGRTVCDCYLYLAQARAICSEIIFNVDSEFLLGDADTLASHFPTDLKLYVLRYRGTDIKSPPSLDEWRASPEFAELYVAENRRATLEREKAQYADELHSGDWALAWVADDEGELSRADLRDLLDGRRFAREGVSPLAQAARAFRILNSPNPGSTSQSVEGNADKRRKGR